ncbi:MAG: T9SS type A sorting domain-containing protein [Saprospiraceae bacterium]|nr:T9SS type A sorting domain-containing protein [Saprospiraceae bacterium]
MTFKLAEMAESQEVTFELYNQLGQLVLSQDFGRVAYVNERIDLSGIGSGLYIVSVKAGGVRYEQKLVVGRQ